MKVGGAIFGGIQAAKAQKKIRQNIEKQRAKNQAWYDRRYNEDATQRADAQAALANTLEAVRQSNRAAAGAAAVGGGTEESVAAARAANAQAIADTNAKIALAGAARKDTIEQQYQANENSYVDAINKSLGAQATAISQAAQGAGDVGSQLMGSGASDKTAS